MENSNRNNEEIFSKRVRAGRRRTYFIDVRTTRSSDYYVTITESKKKFDDDGYERHKIHLYKEDFNKFVTALNEAVGHVKTELMPDYDFDQFTREDDDDWHKNKSESSNYEASDDSVAETSSDTEATETEVADDSSTASFETPDSEEAETWE